MIQGVTLCGLAAYWAAQPGAVRQRACNLAKHVGSQRALVPSGRDPLPREPLLPQCGAARRPTNCHFRQGFVFLCLGDLLP